MIPKVREAVRERAGEHCESCGSRGDFRGLQIHHRKHRSQGGLDTVENLWLLCGVCHGAWNKGHPMLSPILYGKVEKGKLILDYPEKFIVRLASLEGKRVEVVVRKETNTRTSQSNRYLFGVVYAVISENTGYDPEQVHDAMKVMFASQHLENGLVITEHTSKMDTVRFSKYVDDIKRWAADFLHCYVPDAGEVDI